MKIEGRWLNASSPFNHPPASKRRFLSSTTSVCLLDEQPCQRAHWQGTYEAPLASRIVLFSPPHDTGPLGSEVIQSGPHPALSAWTGLWMSWSGPEKPFPHRETTDGGRWGELTSTTHPPAPLCNPFLSNILVSTAVQCFPFFFFLFLGILCPKQLCDVSLLFIFLQDVSHVTNRGGAGGHISCTVMESETKLSYVRNCWITNMRGNQRTSTIRTGMAVTYFEERVGTKKPWHNVSLCMFSQKLKCSKLVFIQFPVTVFILKSLNIHLIWFSINVLYCSIAWLQWD